MPNLKIVELNLIPSIKKEFLDEIMENPKFGIQIRR